MIDVPGSYYKKSDTKLQLQSYKVKNLSNQNPLSLMYLKSISSSLYNPNLNTISNIMKISNCDNSNISINIDDTNSIKTQDSYSSSKNISSIVHMHDVKHNIWNDIVSNNISEDSAISMGDNCSEQNSNIKSGNIFHPFELNDSDVDITKSSNLSAFSMSNKYSMPATSTMISNKNIKFNISEDSLLNDEHSLCENVSNFEAKSNDLKMSASHEKNNEHIVCTSPINNNALSLKYYKNIHYIRNNTSKAKITPKRYIKWRKTNSCTSVHKTTTHEKYKFVKTNSYPNILKYGQEQYSDTFLYNALDKRNKHLSKSHTSIFSKISHFNFCPTFFDNEQDTLANSHYSPPEKNLFKKKYTSLSKSFPISTKISNTKHNSRNTYNFNGKSCGVQSTSHDIKTKCTDFKIQKDKPLVVFNLNFSFFLYFVC